MLLHLLRDQATDELTLGVLTLPTGRKLYTIERPWVPSPHGLSGVKYESCVSDGVYRLDRHSSEKFGQVWALVNPALDVYHYPYEVPRTKARYARTAILIHAGNWVRDVIGCIAPGKTRARVEGEWMVLNSRDALNELRTVIGSKIEVSLEVIWAAGVQPRTSSGGDFQN